MQEFKWIPNKLAEQMLHTVHWNILFVMHIKRKQSFHLYPGSTSLEVCGLSNPLRKMRPKMMRHTYTNPLTTCFCQELSVTFSRAHIQNNSSQALPASDVLSWSQLSRPPQLHTCQQLPAR